MENRRVILVIEEKDSITFNEYKQLSIFTQLLVRCIKDIMSEDFIKENNVKDYHLNLIERMYFNQYDIGDCDIIISLGEKRPYGNSFIEGDIHEEISISSDSNIRNLAKLIKECWRNDDDWDNYADVLWDIHDETIEILLKYIKSDDWHWVKDFEITADEVKVGKVTKRKKKLQTI